MKTELSYARTREAWPKRLLHSSALPALVVAPVLALSLGAPDVAFAAETDAELLSGTVESSISYTCYESSTQGNAATGDSLANAELPGSQTSPPADVVSAYIATGLVNDSGMIAESSNENDAEWSGMTESVNYKLFNQDIDNDEANISTISGGEARGTIEFDFGDLSDGPIPPEDPVENSSGGSVEFFDSHEADITFSSTVGGSIVAGPAGSAGAVGAGAVTEHFGDSLGGESQGATAVADQGFEFSYWVDGETGNVLSTSTYFVPERPEEGWPETWEIQAVFQLGTYVVILDPNGGNFSGGGGGSSGAASFDVSPGTDFQFAADGSLPVQVEKPGATLAGWMTVANSESGTAPDSLFISGSKVFDAAFERDLVARGFLVPYAEDPSKLALKLVAQWKSVPVLIAYVASTGGAVLGMVDSTGEHASSLEETLGADTGERMDGASGVGPSGARAVASARCHFTGWSVDGSTVKLTDAEALASALSPDVVERLSRFVDEGSSSAVYHAITLTANFAPNTYIVSFEGNGGEGSLGTASVGSGTAATAPQSGLSRDGYELAGWNTVPDGSGLAFALGSTLDSASIDKIVEGGYLEDADGAQVKLYAQWFYVQPEPEPEPAPVPAQPQTPVVGDEPAVVAEPGPAPVLADVAASSDRVAEIVATFFEPKTDATVDVPQMVEVIAATAEKNAGGLLASRGKEAAGSPVVAYDSRFASAMGSATDGDVFSQLMTPEGMEAAGTTVAAVAAVGALAGLVGVGVSMAGAVMLGAAALGTAGAAGLTSVADLAADLAVAGADGKRRRREEEDDEAEGQDDAES